MKDKAHRLGNLIYSVIEKCCNTVLMGKTYLKNVALPSILFETNVIHLTNSEAKQSKQIENSVY